MFEVTVRDGPRASPGDSREMVAAKLLFKLGLVGDRALENPSDSPTVGIFLRLLEGWRTADSLQDLAPRATVYRILDRLRRAELVEERRGGRRREYRVKGGLPTAALEYLETSLRVYLEILRMEARRLEEESL